MSLTVLLMLAVAFCQMKAHASANAAESIAENVTESTVESAAESTTESTEERAVESTAESAPESTVESAPESTVESAPESKVENTPESTSENAAESAPESTPEKAEESIPEIAAENTPENVTVPTVSSKLISVELPMIEERNPFNFFIDPLHIFYNTFSNSDGDITVEEGTCLLFYNRDESGEALSSRSDSLEIRNRSTVPIEVTITAKIENAAGIAVVQNKDFADRSSCDLYLALVDNEGNEQPLSGDGEVSIVVCLDRAPLDAYAFVLNEDTGEYQYACQSENVAFDTYSFGLMGACNEKGDWANISGRPHVTISWNVEPVVSEESGAGGELDKKPDENPEDITESSASAGDVPDEDGESSGGQAADDDGNPTEDASGDTGGQAPENGRPDEKETTEESGSGTESSGADETNEEITLNEDNQNEGEPIPGGDEHPTEDKSGDTEGSASGDGESAMDSSLDFDGDANGETESGKAL